MPPMRKQNALIILPAPIPSGGPSRPYSTQAAGGLSLHKWNSRASGPSPRNFSGGTHLRSLSFSSPRCQEKGCVFPAAPSGAGRCEYHERQRIEPVLFSSQQPSNLLLERAKFGPADPEPDDARRRERRKLAMLWEEFQAEDYR